MKKWFAFSVYAKDIGVTRLRRAIRLVAEKIGDIGSF